MIVDIMKSTSYIGSIFIHTALATTDTFTTVTVAFTFTATVTIRSVYRAEYIYKLSAQIEEGRCPG